MTKLAHAEDFPHLLFYGPNGAGKKTRVLSFLHELYGPGVTKLKAENEAILAKIDELPLSSDTTGAPVIPDC